MNDKDIDAPRDSSGSGKLNHALRTMPAWKRMLLGLSLLVGLIGLGGQLTASSPRTTPVAVKQISGPTATSGKPSVAPPGSSGFVGPGNGPVNPSAPSDSSDGSAPPPATVTQTASPFLTRMGLSVFIGVVVGVIFRTFIKMAATLTAVVLAIAFALNYYHIFNVDMTEVKTQTANAGAWFADQGDRLKTMVFSALPSTTGATLGFLFGLKRR